MTLSIFCFITGILHHIVAPRRMASIFKVIPVRLVSIYYLEIHLSIILPVHLGLSIIPAIRTSGLRNTLVKINRWVIPYFHQSLERPPTGGRT
jgi:hypothetical protein